MAMGDKYKYSSEISDYLFNEMSELQRAAFENRLELDKDLAAEVKRQRLMFDSIHDQLVIKEIMDDPHLDQAEQLAEQYIQERDEQIMAVEKKREKKQILLKLLKTAASITILLVIGRYTSPGIWKDGLKNQRSHFVDLWKAMRK